MPPEPEARRDLLSAAGLAVVALVYLAAARGYPLDTLAAPGPGVFPLAVGFLLLGLAAGQALAAVRSRRGAVAPAPARGGAGGIASRRVAAMAAVLVGYAGAVGVLGFLTASFALVLVSSRLLGAPGWRGPAALALGVTVAAHAIFVAWLGVRLPTGLLR